jgi:hypothetical protein
LTGQRQLDCRVSIDERLLDAEVKRLVLQKYPGTDLSRCVICTERAYRMSRTMVYLLLGVGGFALALGVFLCFVLPARLRSATLAGRGGPGPAGPEGAERP